MKETNITPSRRGRSLLVSTAFLSCSVVLSTTGRAQVDSHAMPQVERIVNYLKVSRDRGNDGNTSNNRVLSGQAGLHGSGATTRFYDDATAVTGKSPAILAMSYDFSYSSGSYSIQSNPVDNYAEAHWDDGGLVVLSPRFRNPTNTGQTHRYNSNFQVNLAHLLRGAGNESRASYQRFWEQVDVLAVRLNRFEDRGVPVMMRLFWEMDIPAGVFWWGGTDTANFKDLWIDVVNYLRTNKSVHSVAYVFCPAGSNNTTHNERNYYPGSNYVDLLAMTAYSDDFTDLNDTSTSRILTTYSRLLSEDPSKPFGFGEVGPKTPTSVFDWRNFASGLHSNFQRTTFFVAHNHGWSLSNNQASITATEDGVLHKPNSYIGGILNDSWVENRPNLPDWTMFEMRPRDAAGSIRLTIDKGGNGQFNDGDNADLSTDNNSGALRWRLLSQNNGTYELQLVGRNSMRMTVLDPPNDGTSVKGYDDFDGLRQRWDILPIGDRTVGSGLKCGSFELRPKKGAANLRLTAIGLSSGNNVAVKTWNNVPLGRQRWQFVNP